MKRWWWMIALSASLALGAGTGMGANMADGKKAKGMYQSVPVKEAEILQTGESKMYCPNCGMFLPKFYRTGHAVRLKDGTARQYCSIYCLVEEMEFTELRGKKNTIDQVMVVDNESLKFIDAKQAHYVVGSSKSGTMTTTSKYAFKDKAAAEKFAKENGGSVTGFDGAYEAALGDFAKDTAYVFNMRSSKMYQMGEKLVKNQCDQAKMQKMDAHTMGDMKAIIQSSNLCGTGLSDSQLQGIMLYWWDVKMQNFEKRFGKNEAVQKHIKAMQEQ